MDDLRREGGVDMRNYQILLAYDDPLMLKLIGQTLEDRGQRVTIVRNGDEAIELLEKGHFDLVPVDLVLNPSDGISVMKKAKEINLETMVILLGCKEDATSDQDALPKEADEYVSRPCGMAKLWRRVANCLEKLELSKKESHAKDLIQESNERIEAISKSISHDITDKLNTLAKILRQLKWGSYGKINRDAEEKLSQLLEHTVGLIEETETLSKSCTPVR